MPSGFVDYQQLNGFNSIFLDYISRKEKFFPDHFERLFSGQADFTSYNKSFSLRKDLHDTLLDYNRKIGVSEKTIHHIEHLLDENTLAVVTGQQVGLFGGPLYTIYKIIGAIQTAEKLQTLYPDYRFIPIFWMEDEDSDFKEINWTGVITAQNEYKKIYYKNNFQNSLNNPICTIRLTEDILHTEEEILDSIIQTEFTNEIFSHLRESYRPETFIHDAFAGWINRLFKDYGLVLYHPSNGTMKRYALSLFRDALENADDIHQIVQRKSKWLKDNGYTAQVQTKPSYLYCLEKQHPFNIRNLNKFRIHTPLSIQEKISLLELMEEKPECFIPNVLLRPLVQDTIIPVAAYVAGPAEIAYMAQIAPLYEYWKIEQPYIVPRPSVTIVENKIAHLLEKYSVSLIELLNKNEENFRALYRYEKENNVSEKISRLKDKIITEISDLRSSLESVDISLSGALDTTIKKMKDGIDVLQKKTEMAENKKTDNLHHHIHKIKNHLLPDNDFQERKINTLYFINKYHLDFIQNLYSQISIQTIKHQIIYL